MESVRPFHHMTVVQLRELAREKKVRLPYGVNKAQIVDLLSRELRAPQDELRMPQDRPLQAQEGMRAPDEPEASRSQAFPAHAQARMTHSEVPAPRDELHACATQTPAAPAIDDAQIGLYKPKPLGYYNEEYGTSNPVVPKMLKAGLLASGEGVLEVQAGGYGFLRAQN